MRIADEVLDYWADEFVRRGLSRYMTLPEYLRNPEEISARFDSVVEFRPLLREQHDAIKRLRGRSAPSLCDSIDELELTVERFVRRGGHWFEPMKHRAYPR